MITSRHRVYSQLSSIHTLFISDPTVLQTQPVVVLLTRPVFLIHNVLHLLISIHIRFHSAYHIPMVHVIILPYDDRIAHFTHSWGTIHNSLYTSFSQWYVPFSSLLFNTYGQPCNHTLSFPHVRAHVGSINPLWHIWSLCEARPILHTMTSFQTRQRCLIGQPTNTELSLLLHGLCYIALGLHHSLPNGSTTH